jgi:hypothetical protein
MRSEIYDAARATVGRPCRGVGVEGQRRLRLNRGRAEDEQGRRICVGGAETAVQPQCKLGEVIDDVGLTVLPAMDNLGLGQLSGSNVATR